MLGIRGYIQFNMGERSDYGWDVEGSSGFIRSPSHGSGVAMVVMVAMVIMVTMTW